VYNLGEMKRLLAYLFIVLGLGLVVSVKADDIRDFQIEGMSVGDSLLDYYSEKEINKSRKVTKYKDKTYTTATFYEKLNMYDAISVSYKTKDNNFIIEGIRGNKVFNNRFKECYKQQDQIFDELKLLFPKSESFNTRFKDVSWSKSGSNTRQSFLKFNDGSFSGVQCYKYSKKDKKKFNVKDYLGVSLTMKEYNYWLTNIAFK
jgi:hypothetical protein